MPDETRKPKNRPRKQRSADSAADNLEPTSSDSANQIPAPAAPPDLPDVPELPPPPEARPQPAPKKKPAENKAAESKAVEKPAPPKKAPAKEPKSKAAEKASRPTQEQEAQQRRGKGKPKEPGKTPLGILALKAIGGFLFRLAIGKKAAAEPVPVGRILRIIFYARMIVRLGPALVILLILALIVGPAIYRVAVPPTPIPAVAPLFTRSVEYWAPQITRWSEQYDVNANLIATLMQIESCGYPGALSSVGAQGLFQVMPMNFSDADQSQMTVPDINAKTGVGVIKDCLDYARKATGNDDVGLAMACYNGGPSLIYRDPSTWPLESQHYYTWGGGIFNDAEKNASHSDTLDAWLDAGGIGLCQKAEQVLGLSTSTAPITPLASLLPAHTATALLPTLDLRPANTQANPSANKQGQAPGALPTYSSLPQGTPGKATATPGLQIYVTP